MPQPSTPTFLAPGALISGKYRLLRPIGEGAMGSVWAATNVSTSREVALKLIVRPEPEFRLRLQREARALGSLKHKNIIDVYDIGQTEAGDPFLVMQLLRGETVSELLTRKRRLDAPTAARIGRDVAKALSAAHALSIVHRDLKPANIFLHQENDDEPQVVKVLDFGVAKNLAVSDGLSTVVGGAVGSPLYMSPEQVEAKGDIDPRSDIWALGVVIFEMLTGRRPFDGDAQEVFASILAGSVPTVEKWVRHIDPAFSQVVERCMRRRREERFATAAEIVGLLDRFASDSAGMRTTSSEWPRQQLPSGQQAAGQGSDAAALRGSSPSRSSAGSSSSGMRGRGSLVGSSTGPGSSPTPLNQPSKSGAGSGAYPAVGSGQYPAVGSGQHPAAGSGLHPAVGSGLHAAKGSGQYPAAGSGQYPAAGSGQYPAAGSGQHPAAGSGLHSAAGSGQYPAVEPPGEIIDEAATLPLKSNMAAALAKQHLAQRADARGAMPPAAESSADAEAPAWTRGGTVRITAQEAAVFTAINPGPPPPAPPAPPPPLASPLLPFAGPPAGVPPMPEQQLPTMQLPYDAAAQLMGHGPAAPPPAGADVLAAANTLSTTMPLEKRPDTAEESGSAPLDPMDTSLLDGRRSRTRILVAIAGVLTGLGIAAGALFLLIGTGENDPPEPTVVTTTPKATSETTHASTTMGPIAPTAPTLTAEPLAPTASTTTSATTAGPVAPTASTTTPPAVTPPPSPPPTLSTPRPPPPPPTKPPVSPQPSKDPCAGKVAFMRQKCLKEHPVR